LKKSAQKKRSRQKKEDKETKEEEKTPVCFAVFGPHLSFIPRGFCTYQQNTVRIQMCTYTACASTYKYTDTAYVGAYRCTYAYVSSSSSSSSSS
jgi:hypothetical protein